jgi:hypothetical protein
MNVLVDKEEHCRFKKWEMRLAQLGSMQLAMMYEVLGTRMCSWKDKPEAIGESKVLQATQ